MLSLRKLKSFLFPPKKVINKSQMLFNVCKFVVNERIEGDYYEFGIYQGYTLISAYWLLNTMHLNKSKKDDSYNMSIWDGMTFHAYDSFQGLPSLSEEDRYSDDFKEGQYKCSTKQVVSNFKSHGINMNKIQLQPGWFDKTCNPDLIDLSKHKKASLIWLDCDLHSSAQDVFRLITYLLQDGTIIVIDDWFSNKGSPYHGVQKAFYEWLPSIESEFKIHEYIQDSWKRKSFIVSSIPRY